MPSPTLLVERDQGVVTLTMNRPHRKNAADGAMWSALLEAFREIAANPADRAVVLTGAGGDFCSGADVAGMSSRVAGADGNGDGDDVPKPHQLAGMRHIADIAMTLYRLPQPTVAKVRGIAAGAGLNMALLCDLVVASDNARFSEIFARRGLSLDGGGSWLLPRLVGLHKAKELALFAEVIPAQEALRLGVVNRVVPASELDTVVGEWAARLAAGPPIALAMTKRMLNRSFEQSFEQALDDEARSQTINFGTRDTVEAISAFLQKRPPLFEGR